MKKILIFIIWLIGVLGYSQTNVDYIGSDVGSGGGTGGVTAQQVSDTADILRTEISDSLTVEASKARTLTNHTIDYNNNNILNLPSTAVTWDSVTFTAPKTISFATSRYQYIRATSNFTLNVSNLNVGDNTLWIQNEGTVTTTIGTGWGDALYGTGSLNSTDTYLNVVQFQKYNDDKIIYGINYVPDFISSAPSPEISQIAQAFIDSSGITGQDSIDIVQLVTWLVDSSLMNDMIAFYPIIGGDSVKHKWNLVDPATFPIRWVNTATAFHTADGVLGNGASHYGDTHINDLTHLANDSVSMGCYVVTGGATGRSEMGIITGSTYFSNLITKYSDNKTYGVLQANFSTSSPVSVTAPSTTGFYCISRNYNTMKTFNADSVIINTTTLVDLPRVNYNHYILTRNSSGTPESYTASTIGLFFYGYYLTEAKVATLYNIVQAYQTLRGRQR